MVFNTAILKLKNSKSLLQTLLFFITVFLISSLSLFLSYILKKLHPAEYGLIQGNNQDLELTYKEILFFASVAVCFFLLSLAYRYIRHRQLKLVVIWFALLYLFAAGFIILVDVVYYLIFAYRLNFSIVQTILNTNPDEVKGFVKLYTSVGPVIAIVLFIAAVVLVIRKRKRLVVFFSGRAFFMTSLVFTLLGIADFGQMAYSESNGPHNVRYWDIIIGEYNEYNAFNRRLAAEKNSHSFSKEYSQFFKKDTLTKTLVLVVSESLNKRHMSLYGYPRSTTPNLDTNKSIYVFNDCVTQAALTIEAVPGLFFNGHFSKKINLVTLLNKQGYETSWISNQSGWGKRDAGIVLLSGLCKNKVFMDGLSDDNKSNSSYHYDEDVLSHFSKALNTPGSHSKFIVLHLMGCHYEYEKRYPVNRHVFATPPPAKTAVSTEQTQTILNTYDNALLYHDSVVNQIIRTFSKYSKDKNAALVFLSDHGEELYENRNYAGHGYPPSRVTSEIPYFTLLSPEFKKNYPAIDKTMKSRVNTPYSTYNNFYTLVHLLNLDAKEHKSKILRNGFFSPYYDSTRTRLVMGLDYSTLNQ